MQGWGSRLTWASAILAGAPEGKAADHLGQHTAQQHVQQDDSVALSQALADAARHQGYHVAHLGHSWGQYTLGWGRERVGWNLLMLGPAGHPADTPLFPPENTITLFTD